jgi:transposase
LARTINKGRALLLADHSQRHALSDDKIAVMLNIAPNTIFNTRRRFVQSGLEAALYDKPRPGKPRKLDGAAEAHFTLLACSQAPDGHARWTVRLLADQIVALGIVESVSHNCVAETLKKRTQAVAIPELVYWTCLGPICSQNGRHFECL